MCEEINADCTGFVSILNNLDTSRNIRTSISKTKAVIAQSAAHLKKTGNTSLDSQVLSAASNVAYKCATNSTNTVNPYNHYELARHISENPGFWEYLLPHEVPVVSYLHGTLDRPVPKQREERQRTEKQAAKPLKKPCNISSIDSAEATSKKMLQFLQSNYEESLCSYFHLVLDPESFTRTVENIYDLSFLVKENSVEIFIDKGLPYIKMITSQQEETEAPERETNHFIDSIDMKNWRDMLEALQITEPLFSSRNAV